MCRQRFILKVYDTDTVSNTKGLLEIDMKYSKSIVLCKRRISKIQDKRKFEDSKIGTVFFLKKAHDIAENGNLFNVFNAKFPIQKPQYSS